jgi:hypothetical protein
MLILHLWDERCYLSSRLFHAYSSINQGILRLRGRPSVAYDQQGLVFAVAMEGGAIKLFDSRSYDKVCSECNTEQPHICGSLEGVWNIYLVNKFNFRVHLTLSWLVEIQLKFLTSNLATMASLCFWQQLTTIYMFWMHMEGISWVILSYPFSLLQIPILVVHIFWCYILLLISQRNLQRCGFSLEPSPNVTNEAAFTPDGQYVISGNCIFWFIWKIAL